MRPRCRRRRHDAGRGRRCEKGPLLQCGGRRRPGALYAEEAVNHQGATDPLQGREAIVNLFRTECARATMVCEVEQILKDGEWAVLEWRDPLGLRGCGFFRVRDGRIVFQRGYFDPLCFFRQQGLAVPDHYLG
ncbi:nuclear transport factor 2 family protein [Pseudoxanthomonas sp.]|uniref:nuclear transport factor 2 family protein n=1 Tax=Pseudoxanthomonas sp. TaxID=1871049 RepID=UPI0035B33E01